jgi:hypothetical protein
MRILAILLAATFASAAAAETPAPVNASPLHPQRDTLCVREQDTGSRLRTHVTCVTRAQWRENSRVQRQLIERAQTNRFWPGDGG